MGNFAGKEEDEEVGADTHTHTHTGAYVPRSQQYAHPPHTAVHQTTPYGFNIDGSAPMHTHTHTPAMSVPGSGGGMQQDAHGDGMSVSANTIERMDFDHTAEGDSAHAHTLTHAQGEEGDGELVPTVFRWDHGGRNVFITGTFNNWEQKIPMHRSGNDFTYIHNLKKGKHAFKFIVDDEWRFAPDQVMNPFRTCVASGPLSTWDVFGVVVFAHAQPTVADVEGRINNYIDVSEFVAYTGEEDYLADRGTDSPVI